MSSRRIAEPEVGRASADLDASIMELMGIEERGDCADLMQFRSRIAAHQYRRLYALLREHVPAGSRVLDWGCGNGHFSFVASRLGYRVVGFSFEDFCLRRFLPADYQFVRGDESEPVRLPFEAGEFAAVSSVGVLEHVRETGGDEAASLHEIARVLRPGGSFLCYHFPNQHSWIDYVSARIPGYHHHTYRYTRDDIARLCRGSGLELVRTGRYAALPRNLTGRLPRALRASRWAAAVWNAADRALEVPLSPWSQNHYFVARKPDGEARTP